MRRWRVRVLCTERRGGVPLRSGVLIYGLKPVGPLHSRRARSTRGGEGAGEKEEEGERRRPRDAKGCVALSASSGAPGSSAAP